MSVTFAQKKKINSHDHSKYLDWVLDTTSPHSRYLMHTQINTPRANTGNGKGGNVPWTSGRRVNLGNGSVLCMQGVMESRGEERSL